MKFYIGQVISFDDKTFEIEVYIEKLNSLVKPLIINNTSVDARGSGIWSAPAPDTMCTIIEYENEFYLLGYFNLPTFAGGSAGLIRDDDLFPKYELKEGEYLFGNDSGSSVIMGKERFNAFMGVGANLRLVGGEASLFDMTALRSHFTNGAGSFNWKINGNDNNNNASTWEWKIQKQYEKDITSDYVISRRGAIGNNSWKVGIYEDEVIHYDNDGNKRSQVFISNGLNDDGSHHVLNIENIADDRSMKYSLVGADEYLNMTFDDKYSKKIDNDGNVKISSGSWYLTSEDIKIGSDSSSEPLVLGNILKGLLEDFADIFKNSKHLHPQGPTTGLFPPDKIKVDKWKARLPDALSEIASTQKKKG